ncbi:hypothetical protein [Nocardia sp. XZ_19_369]|uniref:hypothetical protein n=1 Tax=Nocardia sp. XZ_19_369 TaxID=2769487 RepID=UPI00188F18C9|nr:hypothetical protein [Nocardia sp. XZ_19_369]
MLAIKRILLAVLTIATAVILGTPASHAGGYTEEQEQRIARELYSFLCEDGGRAPRSRVWYQEYAEIQWRAPYEWDNTNEVRVDPNGNRTYYYNPLNRTLVELYGHEFNPATREAMCSDPTLYARTLKENVIAHKGVIKACCATEDGMAEFFKKKLDDQIALNEQQTEAIEDPDDYKESGKDPRFLEMWICNAEDFDCW